MTIREAATCLQRGETVQFRPRGHSMKPYVHDGDLVTVAPVDLTEVVPGTIVVCKVRGSYLLHRVLALKPDGSRLIGNASGRENGWTKAIFGMATKVER